MEIVRFALLGLGAGSIYGLMAQGLIVVNRGSGVINFAQGAISMVAAFSFVDLHDAGMQTPLALVVVVAGAALFGVLIQVLIMSPLRAASNLTKIFATIGLFTALESYAVLRYGNGELVLTSVLSQSVFHPLSGVPIGWDEMTVLIVGVSLTVALWGIYRWTMFGKVTEAAAENPLATAAMGHAPTRISGMNWAMGSAVAALAGVLIAQLVGLQIDNLALLIVPALAAAVAGRMTSFPITFVAGLVIGVAESLVGRYVSAPGWPEAVPFLFVLALFIVRGRNLPTRGTVLERLPRAETGSSRHVTTIIFFAVLIVITYLAGADWAAPIAVTAVAAILGLSIVVVIGYAGQISLAPYALAGIGALVAARFAVAWGLPFLVSLLIGAVAAVPAGLIVAMPALRSRGAQLAIITFGMGVAIEQVVFLNRSWTGGISGLQVGKPEIFGWKIDSLFHARAWAITVLVILLVFDLAVLNIRRGSTGRRLLAVRGNERAAASLGISVWAMKLYAFGASAFIAGAAGVLVVFGTGIVQFSVFDAISSLVVVSVVVLGGIGYRGGAMIGGLLISGGVISYLFRSTSFDNYLPLISGVGLILTLILYPDGLWLGNMEIFGGLWTKVRGIGLLQAIGRGKPQDVTSHPTTGTRDSVGVSAVPRVLPLTLEVKDISVKFGGVIVLDNVSITVRPGEVVGLIGPNGAGKTTLIDAITGFAPSTGTVRLGDQVLNGLPPHRRAHLGVSRSFQAIELFEDLTVAENIAVAGEGRRRIDLLKDLVYSRRPTLTPEAAAAVVQFGLGDVLDKRIDELSFATRRIVGIVRCLVRGPSTVLLDEPAAGLDAHEVAELTTLVRALAEDWGMAVLLVEHHLEMISAACDRVVVLALGRKIAEGLPAEMAQNALVREAYIGIASTDEPSDKKLASRSPESA